MKCASVKYVGYIKRKIPIHIRNHSVRCTFFYDRSPDYRFFVGYGIHFEDDERQIRLKVEYHHTTHEINYQYIPDLKKTVAIQEWDADYFIIDPNQNHFLRENMIDPSFGFFYSTKEYDDVLSEYASKIKENPNSLYYMSRMATTSDYYRSKKDIAQLYYLFSDEIQRSYFGQITYKHFSTFKIENVSLINCDTKMEERIVVDPNKHTLLIFSASWCAPCHKKIPMLKEIYEKMNMTLDLVYITIDDEKFLPQWEKLMIKENIPWRSLSLNDNKELQDRWNIKAIPDYILINQGLDAKKISLNDENDINNLIAIIQNN
ncbi:hypothetical protein AGMMS50239_09280 [Bacteroidia bacterium]|nr:hypothetical protein AGMMS50239_09280 [Bacteroidia bacterium]